MITLSQGGDKTVDAVMDFLPLPRGLLSTIVSAQAKLQLTQGAICDCGGRILEFSLRRGKARSKLKER
jgi:hypothetical protein